MERLTEVIGNKTDYAYLKNASKTAPGNLRKKSVFIKNSRCLLHLYLVKEPDATGYWKICGLENECEEL